MNGSFLLDANIVIAMLEPEQPVIEKLDAANEVYVPSIVFGELYFGAYKSARVEENLAEVARISGGSSVLNCDLQTARYYGQIRSQLRRIGRPMPENDIWISAIALQHDLTLVSRDSHFDSVESLEIEVW